MGTLRQLPKPSSVLLYGNPSPSCTMSCLAFALLVLLPLAFGHDCMCGKSGLLEGDFTTICNSCTAGCDIPALDLPKGDNCDCSIFGGPTDDGEQSCIKCKTSCF